MLPPDRPPTHFRLLIVISRTVSGLICLVAFIWASRYFEAGELAVSIFLMTIPMAMIWYPKEIDELGKGRYGEGGGSYLVVAGFGWACLLFFLVLIKLKMEGYW